MSFEYGLKKIAETTFAFLCVFARRDLESENIIGEHCKAGTTSALLCVFARRDLESENIIGEHCEVETTFAFLCVFARRDTKFEKLKDLVLVLADG
ncbi:MAG: hypothetical protein II981_10210 [Bacteroidales bacterium]|nr:hypothetical protein [Bacteroidales bacterium]